MDIKKGDEIWLNIRNIKTKVPSKKLNSKWESPFKVLKKVEKVDFKLDLPGIIKQHPVFHTSLLSKNPADPLPKQAHPKPEPVKMNDNDDEEYEINDVIDVKTTKGMIRAQIK